MNEPGDLRLDPRKAHILTAIVREYVRTGEPVGSRRIVESERLDVSAATVRNEMAALEEGGFIAQPHTSAGRVPTDKGYRFFVDAIGTSQLIDAARRDAVTGFLRDARDIEDLLARATRVLAQLTHHAALVMAPVIDRSRLKLVELVGLNAQTVLLLVIADTGAVEKRLIEFARPVVDIDLERARAVLNETADGLRMADVPAAIAGLLPAAPAALAVVLQAVHDAIVDDVRRPTGTRVVIGGRAELAGAGTFGTEDLHRLFEVLDDHTLVAALLAESTAQTGPLVRIGEEHGVEELRPTAIVANAYGAEAPGSVGVIGPTRMDYPDVIAAVRAVAAQLQASLVTLGMPPPPAMPDSPPAPGPDDQPRSGR